MKKAVPAIEMSGWGFDPQTTAIKLFNYSLQSEEWQSNIFEGNITSVQGIVIEHQGSPEELASELQEAFRRLFSKYFDEVSSTVTAPANDNSGRYTLDIDLSFTQDNKTYSLGSDLLVRKEDGNTNRTIEAINLR